MLASAMEVTTARYIYEIDATKYLGGELRLLHRKKVYILGGRRALNAALPRIEPSLIDEGIQFEVGIFEGYCTYENAQAHAMLLHASGCDSIVGVGGGKCLDTAKIISKLAGVPLGMIPTQLGTCVCCTNMAIVYESSGAYLGACHPDKPISFVLADYSLLVESPIRCTASGIVDSMAKYPELNFTQRNDFTCFDEDESTAKAGHIMASGTWQLYLANGRQAYADHAAGIISPSFTSIVNTNLVTTGVISGLARGSKQLAIAHSLYNNSTTVFPEVWRNYMHGEIVSVGVVIQQYYNDAPQEEIDDFISIAKDLNAPVCFKDLGLEGSSEELDAIQQAISKDFKQFGSREINKLRDALERSIVV
ncbi:MAG: iron-containing alcohol dehydrogenase [Oscillospiraceae bacterium]|nr:iron-containing alcohol dehydrogenase [Oscillospiraceae bacterium]